MNKIQLAIEIVRDQLGEPPWKVASLLVRGKRTLTALLRESEMQYPPLRKALLQLLQQNCLRVTRESDDPEKDTYELDVDCVLMRLRFPVIIKQARETFGDDGSCVASLLLEKGRLTRGEVITLLRRRFPGVERETYGDTMARMIAGHWVQRVPELAGPSKEDKRASSEVLDNIGKRPGTEKRKAPTSRIAVAGDGLQQLLSDMEGPKPEADTEAAATEPPAKKPKPKPRAKPSVEGTVTCPHCQTDNPSLAESCSACGEPMKVHEDTAAACDPVDSEGPAVLYRVNFCQFLLTFRNAEIKRYVCAKYKDVAGRIVVLMLETGQRLTDKHTVTSLPKATTPISRTLLCDRLDVSVERLDTHLTLLMKGHIIQQHAVKRDKEYIVNIQHAMEILRQRAVSDLIFCKFGQLGARIVRILLDKKLVEDRQVQEIALAPQRDVRQTVVDMYKSGYIQLQEVPKSKERNPSESIYLWGVDLPKLHFTLLDALYKTARNLRARLNLERRRVTSIPQSDPDHQAKQEQLIVVEDRFNACLVDVDLSIMLFQNF